MHGSIRLMGAFLGLGLGATALWAGPPLASPPLPPNPPAQASYPRPTDATPPAESIPPARLRLPPDVEAAPADSELRVRKVTATHSDSAEVRTLAAQLVSSEVVEPETASLKGVQPGQSTQAELDQLWDAPKEVENVEGIEKRVYQIEPFDRVEVELHDSIVRSIVVNLKTAVPAEALAKDLRLGFIQEVVVTSPSGEPLGQAYPERGVLFTYEPQRNPIPGVRPPVKQIVLERILPEPFVLRAEQNLARDYRQSRADLLVALKLAPQDRRALWLQSQVLAAEGNFAEAIAILDQISTQDPQNAEYLLTRSMVCEQSGDIAGATAAAEKAVEVAGEGTLVKARGLLRLGDLVGASGGRDYKKAMECHQAALQAAQLLVAEQQPLTVRQAAQAILIEGYLGIAGDIAWGRWKGKETVVPKWLSRATQMIREPLPEEKKEWFEFLVARKALAAYAGMEEPLPDEAYSETVLRLGEKLLDSTQDPLRRAQLGWELGSGMADALQIYLTTGQFDNALKYGTKAVAFLEQAIGDQRHIPGAEYQLGRAYFRMGSIAAMHQKDFHRAVVWFDKALPLLDKPQSAAALVDIGRQGETYVSIAVAYWKDGRHDDAVRLTYKGMELMQQAVSENLLPRGDLAVPYRNLSNMHRAMGHMNEAQQFERLTVEVSDQAQAGQ